MLLKTSRREGLDLMVSEGRAETRTAEGDHDRTWFPLAEMRFQYAECWALRGFHSRDGAQRFRRMWGHAGCWQRGVDGI